MRLSRHFRLAELTRTGTGLGNVPGTIELQNLSRLAHVLEAVRAALGGEAMTILSGYRSADVNARVGGAKHSAHLRGLAADFTCSGFGSPMKICLAIIDAGIQFDQLILEPTWVHLGLSEGAMRQQVLTKTATGYAPVLKEQT